MGACSGLTDRHGQRGECSERREMSLEAYDWLADTGRAMQKVETAGVAYRSRRARQRYARSFDMLRCEGGVPPE